MSPELLDMTRGEFGLPTRESDVFALGMVTFEVRNIHRARSSHGFETPSRTLLQVFTGQVPFPEHQSLAIVMKRIVYGERPPRPRRGGELGLSDELWEFIQSSLVHEAEERPSAFAFVDFLERVTPDIAALKELNSTCVVPHPPSSPTKVMFPGMQPSLVDGLAAFTTRLDRLRADQNPDELSHTLQDGFKQRVLYNLYIFSLAGNTEQTKTLLEVFDKVRLCHTLSFESILSIDV